MSERNFVDFVKICCRSGNGGAGSSHFFRDRLQPRGGPDGGDGGKGGDIIVRANQQLWTLLHLKYRKHVLAGHGDLEGRQGNLDQVERISSSKYHLAPLPRMQKPEKYTSK